MGKTRITDKPSAKWVAWFIGKSKILVHFHNQGRVVGGQKPSIVTADGIKQANKHYETIWEVISRMLLTRSKEELGELFKQLIKELK
jgi:hypothetical protein